MHNYDFIPDNDYLLLTPGPLSTSKRVRAAMLKDLCTWDDDYNNVVQDLRAKLLFIADLGDEYTTILMQGSGSFAVESVITTTLGKSGKLLVLVNGEYGKRIAQIAHVAQIPHLAISHNEQEPISEEKLREALNTHPDITHVAFVHCETTTGILNPLENLCRIIKQHNKILIVDAMSSFGAVPIDIQALGIDFLISSANKCIQGVPGFGFIIAKKDVMCALKGCAKSLCLDIYDQWECMEKNNGKWRFTSPTHVVRAFKEALHELIDEGGIHARYQRYKGMQEALADGMQSLQYPCYIQKAYHSPIITTFEYPAINGFSFKSLYEFLKQKGFVIYPGKLSHADTFRIGNIGDLNIHDIQRLLSFVQAYNTMLRA